MVDAYTLSLEMFKKYYDDLEDCEKKRVDSEIEEYIQTNGVGH